MSAMRNTQSGMSFIEIIVVVALISAVGMIAIPQLMDAQENYRLIAVGSDLMARLQEARILAISRNREHRVRVSSAITYVIERSSWTQEGSTQTLPPGFTMTATTSAVFKTRGNADGATYTITNANGKVREVIVETSGRIHARTP